MKIMESLKSSEFFQGLEGNQLEKIAALCRDLTLKEGSLVFHEGDEAKEMYLLIDGKAVLEMEVRPVKERPPIPTAVEVVTRGEIFGWSALVEPYRYTFSARCMSPCAALAIKGEVFRDVMAKDPSLGFDVMKALAKLIATRLAHTRARLTSGVGMVLQNIETQGSK